MFIFLSSYYQQIYIYISAFSFTLLKNKISFVLVKNRKTRFMCSDVRKLLKLFVVSTKYVELYYSAPRYILDVKTILTRMYSASSSSGPNDKNAKSNPATDLVEKAKKLAAETCVDNHVRDGNVIGVGTGSTALYAIKRIAEKYKSGELKSIVCVPSSFQSRQLIVENDLPLSDLERHYHLDLYIDGADEVDKDLNCIKGGGGCLTQEKIVMSCSDKFYVIADYRKKSLAFGDQWSYIPLEVVPSAYVPVMKRVEATEGGSCKLRSGSGKAGPVITDNGNFIVDWYFPKEDPGRQWQDVNMRLSMMAGIVETGLFVGVVEKAYFGMDDGRMSEVSAPFEKEFPSKKAKINGGVKNGCSP